MSSEVYELDRNNPEIGRNLYANGINFYEQAQETEDPEKKIALYEDAKRKFEAIVGHWRIAFNLDEMDKVEKMLLTIEPEIRSIRQELGGKLK
jgi:hypothetical protein|tara:strand:- start:1662 stop:1940 length:279 start_codon:yes stop_codon:yes gene_type:complete